MRIYKDGIDVGSAGKTGTVDTSDITKVDIGRSPDGPSKYWNGLIDDVRIYNRALSADEIKRLYNAGR
jgi:hypothetical protein